MNRLQNISDLKRDVGSTSIDDSTKAILNRILDTIGKEMDYTQQNIPTTGLQKGEQIVRVAGTVTVKLKFPVQSTDYKPDTILIARDIETGALSLAVSAPLYDKRRKDSFDVSCSTPGTLRWEIKPF